MLYTIYMGPFEEQYRFLYPQLTHEESDLLNQYPKHHEFLFEQFMKSEINTLTAIIKTQLEEQLADIGISSRAFFWVMVVLFIIAAMFLFYG